jgi:hypothetical protein
MFWEDSRPLVRPKRLKGLVGAAGFEPATPSPPDWCANRAALRSEHRGPDGPGFKAKLLEHEGENIAFSGRVFRVGLGGKVDFAVCTDFPAALQFETLRWRLNKIYAPVTYLIQV